MGGNSGKCRVAFEGMRALKNFEKSTICLVDHSAVRQPSPPRFYSVRHPIWSK